MKPISKLSPDHSGTSEPHKHVYDSDSKVSPMQYGVNLSPEVERINSLFCDCGHVNHYRTQPDNPSPAKEEQDKRDELEVTEDDKIDAHEEAYQNYPYNASLHFREWAKDKAASLLATERALKATQRQRDALLEAVNSIGVQFMSSEQERRFSKITGIRVDDTGVKFVLANAKESPRKL